MNRAVATLMIIVVLITGCMRFTESFQGQIQDVRESGLIIDCSDEVNRGKKGVINTIGW